MLDKRQADVVVRRLEQSLPKRHIMRAARLRQKPRPGFLPHIEMTTIEQIQNPPGLKMTRRAQHSLEPGDGRTANRFCLRFRERQQQFALFRASGLLGLKPFQTQPGDWNRPAARKFDRLGECDRAGSQPFDEQLAKQIERAGIRIVEQLEPLLNGQKP
jgi:hypothetical protein